MQSLVWVTLALGLSAATGNFEDVICPVEEYVKVGLEFDTCQEVALSNLSEGSDPCPMLKAVANGCAMNVKHCFTEKGWVRGRKLFFDSLALQYPEMNECNILKDLAEDLALSDTAGRKCSIAQEIVVAQETTRCTTKLQSQMINTIQQTRNASHPVVFYDLLCETLNRIKLECIDPNLGSCYDGRDFKAHQAYMVETLKVSGNIIAIHVANVTDVPSCPVFHSEPYFYNSTHGQSDALIIGLILAVVLLLTVILVALIVMAVRKFRLVPRLQAWKAKVPYEDFVKASTNETQMEARHEETLPRTTPASDQMSST
eukprot:maker-scaffold902_size83268-snap-gene-0.14 protein:Tk04309 transcript:maker-scaffold902_size83268-snap-gene-0.14-mRNA-1 annotation:"chemotaxis protein"